jgi:hypothetical protein
VYAVTGRALWRTLALAAFAVGALGAWAAVATGESLYEEVEGTPVVEALVEDHAAYGEWALWASVATTLLLGGGAVWDRRTGRGGARDATARDAVWLRLAVVVCALAAVVLVGLAGHLGGLMVWGVPP